MAPLWCNLQACVITLSEYDTFLFMGDHFIFMIYVNYFLLLNREEKYIDTPTAQMCDYKFELELKVKVLLVSLELLFLRLVPVITRLSVSQWLAKLIVFWLLQE